MDNLTTLLAIFTWALDGYRSDTLCGLEVMGGNIIIRDTDVPLHQAYIYNAGTFIHTTTNQGEPHGN